MAKKSGRPWCLEVPPTHRSFRRFAAHVWQISRFPRSSTLFRRCPRMQRAKSSVAIWPLSSRRPQDGPIQRSRSRSLPHPQALKTKLRKEYEVMSEPEQIYPPSTRELVEQGQRLAPKPAEAFKALSQSVFADGALSTKTKQLIAVDAAHVTQ